MSLHIQMSDEALRQLKRDALMNKLVSFGVCSGLILLFGGILYFTVMIIQGEVPAEFISYVPPSEDGPPTNTPVAKELTSRSVNTNPTVTPSVIVAQNAVGAVASPVSVDTTGDISFDQMDISMGMDLGEGLGETGGGLGGSTAGGSSLEGTFYDLKLTRNGTPSKLMAKKSGEEDEMVEMPNGKKVRKLLMKDQHAFAREAQKFFKSWNEAALSGYYRADTKLYASSFYVPMAQDKYGPIAFQCDDVCQPSGWIVVYRGRVRAPKTGKFRFVGTGDDYLGVRFNNKVVLESGYRIPSLFDENNKNAWWVSGTGDRDNHWKLVKSGKLEGFEGYELIPFIKELKEWNSDLGGLTAGKVFEVREGQVYPIQVATSEIPGGGFGFMLFIEDLTEGKKVKPGEKYDLFRTNLEIPDRKKLFDLISKAKGKTGKDVNCLFKIKKPEELNAPPFNEDSPVWVAVP